MCVEKPRFPGWNLEVVEAMPAAVPSPDSIIGYLRAQVNRFLSRIDDHLVAVRAVHYFQSGMDIGQREAMGDDLFDVD